MHSDGIQIVVYGRDFHSGLRHGEHRLRRIQVIQDHVFRHDLPVVKALAFDLVGLDDNELALQGCIGLGIFHIGLAAVHRDAQQLLILCDGGHRRIRHDKGGLFRILVKHSNIAVVHFPTVEHIARAVVCLDGDGLALNGGVLVCSAELHADLVQSLEHSLQGHFSSGHRKPEGLVLQLLLRQAVHTGHFPVAELLACGGRACRCNDLIALDSLSRGSAIDGVGALIHRDGEQLLVACRQHHILVRHGEGGFLAVHTAQGDIALPPHKLIARTGIGLHGDGLACVGLVIRHIHGCIGQGNRPRRNGRNVHSICFCVDGRTTRVNRHAALSIRVDVLAAGIDDAACHAARALVLDGDRDRALDRNIAPHDVVTIPLTRDRHRGGPFHRHIAGHGGAFFRSNFHLAVTADLNIAEDGNIGLGRDLDVLCICDRQFASYSCFT